MEGIETGEHDPHLVGYLRCFNAQQFYEAHDVLEALWLKDRKGPDGVEWHVEPKIPTLTLKIDGDNLTLEFTGTLQSADNANGPWIDTAEKNPLTLMRSGLTGSRFYRTKN